MKIEEFNRYFNNITNEYEIPKDEFESLFTTHSNNKMTEKGAKILQIMQEKFEQYNNIFTSKNIGEFLFMPPRSVSGSMKKLIADGYVQKIGVNPVSYGLTDKGKDYSFDRE